MHIAVTILRVPECLDFSGIIDNFENDQGVQQSDLYASIEGAENPAFISEDLNYSSMASSSVEGIHSANIMLQYEKWFANPSII